MKNESVCNDVRGRDREKNTLIDQQPDSFSKLLNFSPSYMVYLIDADYASSLFGVTSCDPLVVIGVPLVLAGVSLISAFRPAIRAGRIDAAEALRRE